MTETAPAARDDTSTGPRRPASSSQEKRPRTTYLLYRRYRMFGRVAALLGAIVGCALVAYSLLPSLSEGEPVPSASFGIAAMIIAATTLVPYGLVRWRGHRLRARLNED